MVSIRAPLTKQRVSIADESVKNDKPNVYQDAFLHCRSSMCK